MTTGLPRAMKKSAHATVVDSPVSKERSIVRAILCLMQHVNAPAFQQTCCTFHGTAIYISFALGHLLSRPCKPSWTVIPTERTEVCVNCGLLVSKNTPCVWCTLCATGSV